MKTTLLTMVAFAAFPVATLACADADEAQEHARARANLPKAKITLVKAVEIATKSIPKGKAVEAELVEEDNSLRFEVEIVTGKLHQEVEIDAMTGEIVKTEEENQADEDQEQEKVETEAAAKAKTSLLKAIEAALKEVKGAKAFEASFEREDGKLLISIEVLAGDKIKEVEYDAMTGKLVEVEDEE